MNDKEIQILRLKITLLYSDPAPWREIEIRSDQTLEHLHDAIQAAFLWEDSHLWQFEIGKERFQITDPDWDMEDVFGTKTLDAAKKTLAFFKGGKVGPVIYTYDFGDNWEHSVTLVSKRAMEEDDPLPRFIKGQWAAPPEDIGGAPMFEALKEAIGNKSHPHYEWVEEMELDDWCDTNIEEDVVAMLFSKLQG